MISRLLKQAYQLVSDQKLKSYWVARGLVASLYFLFGILLRETGYNAKEVIVAWIFVYIAQAALLIALDKSSKKVTQKTHTKLVMFCSGITFFSFTLMLFLEISLILFSLATIMLLPVLRESIHNGTLYVRDRKWEFGPNLASLCANELGKGFGAFFIFLIGYISGIGQEWMVVFLLLLVGLSIKNHSSDSSIENDDFNKYLDIGKIGKGYVFIASLHNGAFTSIKAILSLVVFDILVQKADIDSIITTLATSVSIVLVLGMVIFQIFQSKIEPILRSIYKSSLFTISLAILAALSISGFCILTGFYVGFIPATVASYGLAVIIALIMAIGSLFTLGALQFLDLAFGNGKGDSFNLRKSSLHQAWIGSSFTPSLFLALYLALLFYFNSIPAGIITLGVIVLTEIYVTLKSIAMIRLARES